ncbi:MAG TPA: RagB/SusD family nutrient uptake outer membrane protein, partial [Bacteroidales bacterium]|nr:RagB/SusD family nutrient uptake outer membrane protein [Bacteroidales bacterium]
MKKIFYISIVFLTFTFVSCEKFLEKAPSGSLPTDSAITSIADLNNAVNGVYQELVGQEFSLSGDMFIYGDLKGPDYEFPNNSGWSTPLGVQPVDSKSGHADHFYRIVYTAIGKVNYALEAAKNYTPTTDDQAAYDALTAELHAIRGWMHFQGATYYCKLPTVAGTNMNDANSGLPISDKVTMPGDYTAKRATLNETYNFAIAELEGSLSKLDISKNGGISKYGAEALLARIYLYKGDY